MACPFSGLTRSNSGCSNNENGGFQAENDEAKPKMPSNQPDYQQRKDERLKPCRQSSIQIPSSLLNDEIPEDPEETQTLNLKHLRAAVLMLTNPSVRLYV